MQQTFKPKWVDAYELKRAKEVKEYQKGTLRKYKPTLLFEKQLPTLIRAFRFYEPKEFIDYEDPHSIE